MQQRMMTFSFQTHQPTNKISNQKFKQDPSKQIQMFQQEIKNLSRLSTNQLTTLNKARSRSTIDNTTQQTTIATITPSRNHTHTVERPVAPFETIDISKALEAHKKSQKLDVQPQERAQTDRIQIIEHQLSQLESKKETILQQLRDHDGNKSQQLQGQYQAVKDENEALKNIMNEMTEKEKFYQQTLHQQKCRFVQIQEQNSRLTLENTQLKEQLVKLQNQPPKFEPELLSSQESINFVVEILQRAISSQQMMRGITSNQQLMMMMQRLTQNKKTDISQDQISLFEQTQNYNTYVQPRRYDQVSTNKKMVQILSQKRNQSVNI